MANLKIKGVTYTDVDSVDIPNANGVDYERFVEYESLLDRTITSLIIPEGVTTIVSLLCREFTSLQSVEFPETLTTIQSLAFYKCTSLTSVTIPSSVTSISNSFQSCTGLETVIYEGNVILGSTNSSAFSESNNISKYDFSNATEIPSLPSTSYLPHKSGCIVIIPDTLYDEWIAAPIWSTITGVVYTKASEV